jgi:hypothetical protein
MSSPVQISIWSRERWADTGFQLETIVAYCARCRQARIGGKFLIR